MPTLLCKYTDMMGKGFVTSKSYKYSKDHKKKKSFFFFHLNYKFRRKFETTTAGKVQGKLSELLEMR